MQMSMHALKRLKQRGFQEEYIDIIVNNGTSVKKPGKALEFRLRKRDKDRLVQELKRTIQFLDKCTNKAVLVDEDAKSIISVYNLVT